MIFAQLKTEFDHANNGEVTSSLNGQLIMFGKMVVQLTSDLDEAKDIGVIMIQHDNSKIGYKFLSLFNFKHRKIIKQNLNNYQNAFVTFDKKSVSPQNSEV